MEIPPVIPGDWKRHLERGRAYFAQGEDRMAIGEFQEVVRLAPKECAPAYEMLGEVMARQQRPLHAVVVWFENAANHYGQRGDAAGEARCRERLAEVQAELSPLSPEEALAQARRLYGDNQPGRAVHLLEKAVQEHRGHAELHFRLGEAYLADGQSLHAANSFRRVCEMDPVVFYGAALESLADALATQADPSQLEELYLQALAAHEKDQDQAAMDRCRGKLAHLRGR